MKKVVTLVTGASSGLGKVISELLCKKGHVIYVIARRKRLLEELKISCDKHSGKIIILNGDLSNPDFRKRSIQKIIKKEGRLDYLINNAGFGRSIKFEDQDPNEIKKMVQVNIEAYMHLTNLVLKQMKKLNEGKLIHIGSVVSSTPLPYFTVYNSTKSAVYAFSRSLRYELKNSGITSTVVLPARMKTGFADVAYDCYVQDGKKICVARFNKSAGSPYVVAKNIIKNLDKGKEVITPTITSKIWYFMRYFGFAIDFIMKQILGPKELKHLEEIQIKNDYYKK